MRERDLLKALAEYVIAEGGEKEAARVRVAEILGGLEFEGRDRMDLEDVVRELLAEMGVPSRGKGYEELVCAVAMVAQDADLAIGVTKRLYTEVGKLHQQEVYQVDRNIGRTIERTFERARPDVIGQYFGNSVDWKKGKVTSVEFINRAAGLARKRWGGRG